MKYVIKKIVIGTLALAAVGAAYGVTLYSENFQSYAAGASNFVGSGNGWTGIAMGVNQTNTIGGVGSFFSSTDIRRSLFVNDTTTNITGNQTLIYSSTNSGALSISNNGNIKFSFDYNVRSNDNQNPTFDLRSGGTWALTLNIFSQSNTFGNFIGSTFQGVSSFAGISTANWYHVEITVGDLSTTNDTYNLKVWEAAPAGGYDQAGTLVVDASDIAFRTNVSYVNGFDFRTITPTRSIYYNVDNIKVASPSARLSLIMVTN